MHVVIHSCLLAAVLLGPATGAVPQAVQSGDWVIRWSNAGATGENRTTVRKVNIYKNWHENCCTWKGSAAECRPGWYYEETHRILSTIGALVSFEVWFSGSGGAHPIGGKRYATINLDSGKAGDITQLAKEEVVLKALLAQRVIQENLSHRTPRSLGELVHALGMPCPVDFQTLRSSFRLKAVRGHRIVIEFGLGHFCEAARGNFTAFSIEVPAREEAIPLLAEAARNLTSFPTEDPKPPVPDCPALHRRRAKH
jgi:hypothetical protein